MKIVTADSETHYAWGKGCAGWRLVDLAHLQIREETMPPNAAEEPHLHRKAHQFFYILSGNMTVRLPSACFVLKAGQGLHIPPGQPHWIRNEAALELRFLLVSGPGSNGDRYAVDADRWPLSTG